MNTNQTKIFGTLAILSLLLLVLGYLSGERQGLLLGLLVALGFIGLSFYYSSGFWIDHFRCREIEGADPWRVNQMAQELSGRAKINPPKIYVSTLNFPTILSVGTYSHHGRIIISKAVLENFDSEELRAMLAHEIARIKRAEMFPASALSGLMAPAFLMGSLMDFMARALTLGTIRNFQFFSKLAHIVYASALRALVQPSSYYETDRQAGHLLQNPEKLARVLLKLEAYALTEDTKLSPSASSLAIINPMSTHRRARHFQSQPTVPQRVEKLVGRYPI